MSPRDSDGTIKCITSCRLACPDVCSLLAEKRPDGTVKIRGNPHHPFTRGFTCGKVHRFLQRLRSPHRITQPMLQENGQWRPISWHQALDLCAARIQSLRSQPEAILHIFGDGAKGVSQLVSEFFFASLGSSKIVGSLCDSAGIAACLEDFGSLETNDVADIVNAKAIVNWGKDLSRSSVHLSALVSEARGNGAEVLTITPGGDRNEDCSDRMIMIKPGSDRFLAAAVIRMLLERGRIKKSVIDRTANWQDFYRLILKKSVEDYSRLCTVSLEQIEMIYDFYCNKRPVSTLMGWGLQRYSRGGENVRFINAVAMLSGNLGERGAGSFFNISSMRNFNVSWAAPAPVKPRRSLSLPLIGREIPRSASPGIEMIWVNGSNVINQAPESMLVAQAFAGVPFKVVVDAFFTDTAQRADLVLPCALMFERDEIIGSFLHNYVNYSAKIFQPPGEARSDIEIMTELGKRLDPPIKVPEAEDFFSTVLNSPYLDVPLEVLRKQGFTRAKRPSIAYEGLHFDHPDGKYRLPQDLHAEPDPPPDYPSRLLTLIRGNATHSQILPENQAVPPTVLVSPENPLLKDLRVDRDVFLSSPLGRLKVKVRVLPGLHPEAVIYRRGDWLKCGGGANQLVAAETTDLGEGTAYYSQYVRLEN